MVCFGGIFFRDSSKLVDINAKELDTVEVCTEILRVLIKKEKKHSPLTGKIVSSVSAVFFPQLFYMRIFFKG